MKKHKVSDIDLQILDTILKESGIITDDPNEAAKTVINYDGTEISLEDALSLFEKPEEDNNFFTGGDNLCLHLKELGKK